MMRRDIARLLRALAQRLDPPSKPYFVNGFSTSANVSDFVVNWKTKGV